MMTKTPLRPISVRFPDVALALSDERMLLRCDRRLRWIASTVVGGGIGPTQSVLSLRVARNFNCSDPPGLLRVEAATLGITGRFIGFLTALDLSSAALVESDQPRVLVLVTAGTSNAATPGRSPIARLTPGTINTIALIDGALSAAALVATVQIVTEAKTLALLEAGVRTAEGEVATGTSTDAVAIGHTGIGPRLRYAGPVTHLGHSLGRLVTQGVRISLAGGNIADADGRSVG